MKIIRHLSEMQQTALMLRAQGKKIALVPTMGFLHEGHLSLIEIAKKSADWVVASLFVNPTQFGPQEDLSRYPRDEEGDLKKLASVNTNAVFLPSTAEMYPQGFQTAVHLSRITHHLCGASRPGHFDGVTTVVLKLFQLTQPHVAIFGEKDYQQLAVIRQMTQDLNLPIEIIGGPTIRNSDGLALSSRNSYLNPTQQQEALVLSKAIAKVRKIYQAGEINVSSLLKQAHAVIQTAPSAVIDYLEIVDTLTLEPLTIVDRPARFLLAVKIGQTRLIDNAPVQP